jgi:hypothetical protein
LKLPNAGTSLWYTNIELEEEEEVEEEFACLSFFFYGAVRNFTQSMIFSLKRN